MNGPLLEQFFLTLGQNNFGLKKQNGWKFLLGIPMKWEIAKYIFLPRLV